jgi:hypothetical protein
MYMSIEHLLSLTDSAPFFQGPNIGETYSARTLKL